MLKLLFSHFRVTSLKLKNIKLHFELLAQSRLILEIQFYLFKVHQRKTSPFFWSPTKSSNLYIVISYCSPHWFSKLNLLATRKHETQKIMYSIYACAANIGYQTNWWLVFLVSKAQTCLLSQFQIWYWPSKNNDK